MVLGVLFGPLAIYYGVKAMKQKKAMGETDGVAGLWVAGVLGGIDSLGGLVFAGVFVWAMFK